MNVPRLFTPLYGGQKSAANSKLIYFSSKRSCSYIVFALVNAFVVSSLLEVTKYWNELDLHNFYRVLKFPHISYAENCGNFKTLKNRVDHDFSVISKIEKQRHLLEKHILG